MIDLTLRERFILAIKGGMKLPAQLKIGEFAKLSGVTIKTVLYYHKIGLLPEPARSAGGYRLYGLDELKQMLAIKRMKSLGFSLDKIKGIIGNSEIIKSNREVMLDLQAQLLDQIRSIEAKLARIQNLLANDDTNFNANTEVSSSLKNFTDILGEEAHLQFQNNCPEMYEQERKLYSMIDELQWGLDYQDLVSELAAYFNEHPEKYQQSLEYGAQITAIANLSEESSEIEVLARNYAGFIRSIPLLYDQLTKQDGMQGSLAELWSEMFSEVLGPAQMKMLALLSHYLIQEE